MVMIKQQGLGQITASFFLATRKDERQMMYDSLCSTHGKFNGSRSDFAIPLINKTAAVFGLYFLVQGCRCVVS